MIVLSPQPEALKKYIAEAEIALLHFTADWCVPCKKMEPAIDKLLDEIPNVTYIKADVEKVKETALEYNIQSVPTYFIYHNGQPFAEGKGAMPYFQLKKLVTGE